jgi:2-polyprenyl-3-methyl-5-hydroxy-6-metoxy-1,4-benzoquinol methylase
MVGEMTSLDRRMLFDAGLIPGMRERLADGYARFRTAQAHAIAVAAPPEVGGQLGDYRVRDCPCCGAAPPKEAVLRNHGIDVVTCRECSLTYSKQVMDERADAARYQASDLDIESMRLRCSGPYLELESARAQYYLDCLEQWSPGIGTLLDIGCGTGTTLVEAKARGWKVLGLEPGNAPVQVARERLGEGSGHSVIQGYFPKDLPADRPLFDAISILDVLEHFVDPIGFLKLIRRHLLPSGRLFVQVPNWDSLLVQLEGTASSVICTGHWTYFNPTTLPDVLARAGFDTLHVETVVSEIDRIAAFSDEAKSAAVGKLRPTEGNIAWPDDNGPQSAALLHRLGLGYKLIGVFAPSTQRG